MVYTTDSYKQNICNRNIVKVVFMICVYVRGWGIYTILLPLLEKDVQLLRSVEL